MTRMSRNYGTLISPDEEEVDLESRRVILGVGSIIEQLGEDPNDVDVKALSEVGDKADETENGEREEEEDDDLIPFLEDSELETQELLEASRAGRIKRKKGGLLRKSLTSFAVVVLTLLSLFGLFLVADRFGSGDESTPIFESSGVVTTTSSTTSSNSSTTDP